MAAVDLRVEWRGQMTGDELDALTSSHGAQTRPGWWNQVQCHSLGWVAARTLDRQLVGFVNVAWDGGAHAFLLDTKIRPDHQRQGVATRIVGVAEAESRRAGCEWLHVDFEEHLRAFYWEACGFRPTDAGLIRL